MVTKCPIRCRVQYSSVAAQNSAAFTTARRHRPRTCRDLGRYDAGLFVKNGLNVEPIQIRGGALITMGIMSGQLQFSGRGGIGRGRSGRGRRYCFALPARLILIPYI
jgi:hypothetical protein